MLPLPLESPEPRQRHGREVLARLTLGPPLLLLPAQPKTLARMLMKVTQTPLPLPPPPAALQRSS